MAVWHEHFFSPHCTDEVHGRFDAVEDEDGTIYVLDVGSWTRVQVCASEAEACAEAKRMAEEWRP